MRKNEKTDGFRFRNVKMVRKEDMSEEDIMDSDNGSDGDVFCPSCYSLCCGKREIMVPALPKEPLRLKGKRSMLKVPVRTMLLFPVIRNKTKHSLLAFL